MNRDLIRHWIQRIAACVCFVASVLPANAQTNSVATNDVREIPTRYLFILDTSSAMRRRAEAARTAIDNLLRSSMTARLISGDSIGVWTYNNDLSAGRFPLQRWTPKNDDVVRSNIVTYLKSQRFTGQSRFDAVVPALDRVIKDSERLVILLVSDGDEKIAGTPFDQYIAGAFKQAFAEQQKARMPFVTVFIVSRGKMVNASINLAPWPVFIPDFPPEPKIVQTPKPEPTPEKETPPPPTVPPLIVIGTKSATNEAAATEIAPVTPVAPPDSAITNAATQLPDVEETNRIEVAANSAIVAQPEEKLTPTPEVTPSSVAAPEKPINPASKPDLAPLVATAPAEINSAPPPEPSEETASETIAETKPVKAVESAKHSSAATITNSPTQTAIAEPPGKFFLKRWLLASIGGALILIALGFFVVMRRRANSVERVSLITRSMDRDQK